ncbi:MAG: methionine--tRNA ligase, partial [Ardenticatenaceae bacterium]
EYVRANNDELVATYGNLVHRVLTMVARNFEGKVPEPNDLDEASKKLRDSARARFKETSDNLAACHFRMALQAAMALAHEANGYLNEKAPWTAVKTNPADAATTLWTCLTVINCLKVMTYPFLPSSAAKLHRLLGFDGDIEDVGWNCQRDALPAGQSLPKPEPLFVKLDEAVVEQELQRFSS